MASRSHERLEMPDWSTVGERAFAGKLYSEYAGRLKRMIERRVGPPLDSEDILQEVMLRSTRKWRDEGGDNPPPFWKVYCIADHCIKDAWRKHHGRREKPLPDRSSAFAHAIVRSMTSPSQRLRNEEERLRNEEQAARLVALIGQMSDVDRQVLEMRLLDELSARETAEVLGIEPPAVDARYARARKRLLKLYQAVCPQSESGRRST